ncbi:MAG: hypothetical protein ACOX6K_00685 [Sphaerochaetaceae bacterium]|jgi:hypothetical protein
MILHLYQAIPYLFHNLVPTDDLGRTYGILLDHIDAAPAGSEACLACRYGASDDGILFSVQTAGWSNPPDEAIRKAVEQGETVPVPEASRIAFSIPASDYRFTQLPWTPERTSLVQALLPFFAAPEGASPGSGPFYIRMIKEKEFETTVQLLIPLD